jgi:predicted transcriptional regulator
MADEHGKPINVVLDLEHAAKLQDLAARMYVQSGTLARDQVDSEAPTTTAILEAIPGAWDRTQEGLDDARAGRVFSLDEL